MNPVVRLVEKVYQTGVKLTQQAMAQVEQQLKRLPQLPKWFVEIASKPLSLLDHLFHGVLLTFSRMKKRTSALIPAARARFCHLCI